MVAAAAAGSCMNFECKIVKAVKDAYGGAIPSKKYGVAGPPHLCSFLSLSAPFPNSSI